MLREESNSNLFNKASLRQLARLTMYRGQAAARPHIFLTRHAPGIADVQRLAIVRDGGMGVQAKKEHMCDKAYRATFRNRTTLDRPPEQMLQVYQVNEPTNIAYCEYRTIKKRGWHARRYVKFPPR